VQIFQQILLSWLWISAETEARGSLHK
jgi:hypothetical protein